jgi:phage protein D
VLDCGQFELDAVSADGPPSVITVKGTSLPFGTAARQTKKCRVWESIHLSAILAETASTAGMAFLFESGADPFYDRQEQIQVSDIEFILRLCRDAGLSLKITNNIIVVFDQAYFEALEPVTELKYGTNTYTKWRLNTGSAGIRYDSCRVSYTDAATGRVIEGFAYQVPPEPSRETDGRFAAKNEQRLEITAKVGSIAEAEALAAKRLRLHNKYGITARITLPGNPALTAGVTVTLSNWGMWSGKYIVGRAVHTVGQNGYTTEITVRGVLQ